MSDAALLRIITSLDDVVTDIRTAVAAEPASQSVASWGDLLNDDDMRRATIHHWSACCAASFAFTQQQYRNVVVVGDSRRAKCALLVNVLLGEPGVFDDDNDDETMDAQAQAQAQHSHWSGVVKIVHGATRQFRVVPVDAAAPADLIKWHSWEDSEGRMELRKLLKSARGAAVGFSVELRAPTQRAGVALFDCTRLGEQRLALVAHYIRNADAVLFVTHIDWSLPSARETQLLDLAAADGAKVFVGADFSFAKSTFTFGRFVGHLRQRWPTLFADDTAVHFFSFERAEQAVLRQRLLDVASSSRVALSAPPLGPPSDAEAAAALAREGFLQNVLHFLCSSDDRRAAALVARRLITLAHEVALFASLALNQGQSVRQRDVQRRATSLQGIEASLAMMRQLLEAARDAAAASISDGWTAHVGLFCQSFLPKHSAATPYGTITAAFRAHMHCFAAELEERCRQHADTVRRALLETLAACEAHGAPPCDVDVDWLARSICRQPPSKRSLPRGFDADGVALADHVGEPLLDDGADDGITVPVLSTIVSTLASFVHDNRQEWRSDAMEWERRARQSLVSAVVATAERRNAACQAALARVLELARVQLRVVTLDLALMSDAGEQAREIASRLQAAVTRARTAREELEQLLEAALPIRAAVTPSAPPSPARAAAAPPAAAGLPQLPE
jgi:hypothetical protein